LPPVVVVNCDIITITLTLTISTSLTPSTNTHSLPVSKPSTTQSCGQALKAWEAKENAIAEEATIIKLYAQIPPLTQIDSSVNTLHMCEHLSLSTNSIDRLKKLTGMSKLRVLSVGRNVIKRIENLEDVAGTLEELWISYNQISSLDGLSGMNALTSLYISNNNIKSWSELDKLHSLQSLRDILLIGNPIYLEMPSREEARIEVLRHLPNVQKIDGQMVKPSEREAALVLAA
jgi:dynein light chain 1